MKVICIDAKPGPNGVPLDIKELETYYPTGEEVCKCGVDSYVFNNLPRATTCSGCGQTTRSAYRKSRFIPLSNIDETKECYYGVTIIEEGKIRQ
jgi:hypothetical protein